ncbi:LPD29 domain-containing protein [Nocardia sp. NPDC058379]|uniref:LPD29 domain-containing protein n=1 Tax=unclassified Nocardia TaxID=2637762 RepID=UPI0036601C72
MPRLRIDDRFRILNQYRRTIVADDVPVDEIYTRFEEILTEFTDAHPDTRIGRFWQEAQLRGSGPFTIYQIIPVDPSNADADAQLLAAALRRRWPTAAFTVMPANERSVSIRWVDGPDRPTVRRFCMRVEGHFDDVEFARILSQRTWQSIADLVEAWLPVTVPRTDTGDIDWLAAQAIDLDGTASVAGYRVCRTREPISVTLAELLRHLPDACDLTAPEAAPQPTDT